MHAPLSLRTALHAIVVGGLLALLLAAPALAAPVAGADDMNAAPSGVKDVLANDTGSGALSAFLQDQAAHGQATCHSDGPCSYTGNAGYVGDDTFTYALRDGTGEETVGTVTVHVAAGTAGTPILARDDDVATLAGRAVTIHPLANDEGKAPLALSSNGNPSHGTASCTATDCTYTPAAGFVGRDGFVYTMHDDTQQTRSAAMHVVVAPADERYVPSVDGSPSSVTGAAGILFGIGAGGSPAGISAEELAALPFPDLATTLAGSQSRNGALKTAKGWTADGDSKAHAGNAALLGDAILQSFPRPLPPVSQGTGGDGHVPILVGTKVFSFFHHTQPRTQVSCVERLTGQSCPGYPHTVDVGSTDIIGPAAVVGTRMYVHGLPESNYAQAAPIALYCWDSATDAPCGLFVLDTMPQTSNPGASAPALVNGKIYVAADSGKLYCFDPSNDKPCATPSVPTGLATTGFGSYDFVTHGNRLYVSLAQDKTACIDVTTGGECPSWGPARVIGDPTQWNLVNRHDANGDVNGVCAFWGHVGDCLTDADPSAAPTHVTNWITTDTYSSGYSVTAEGEFGTRTLAGSLSNHGAGCFDWSTMAPCTGGNYGADGWVHADENNTQLPDAYGVASDGSCAVALGNDQKVFTVDPAGFSPCTSLSTGTERRVIDLRDQRFDRTVGNAKWKDVTLLDVNAGELSSVVVTVRDAETNAPLAQADLIKTSGKLDLTGIVAKDHPAVTMDATSRGVSAPPPPPNDARSKRSSRTTRAAQANAWDDGIPPRIRLAWDADPRQVGAPTVTPGACDAKSGTLSLLAHLVDPAGDAKADVGFTAAACPAPGPAAAVTPVTAASVPRVCGGARAFNIHVRYANKKLKSITVSVNGKKQKRLKSVGGRPVFHVDLRKLARSTVKVKVTIKTKSGKTLTGNRVYHPCTKKLPDRGFKF